MIILKLLCCFVALFLSLWFMLLVMERVDEKGKNFPSKLFLFMVVWSISITGVLFL